MASVNTDPIDVEAQPLLGENKSTSRFHKHVYGEKRISKLDLTMLVLYLLHLIGMIVMSVLVFRQPKHTHSETVQREFKWFVFFAGIASASALLLSPAVILLSHLGSTVFIHVVGLFSLAGSAALLGVVIKFTRLPTVIYMGVGSGLVLLACCFIYFYSFKGRLNLNRSVQSAGAIVIARPVSLFINILTVAMNSLVLGYGLYLIHQILIRFFVGTAILLCVLTALSMLWNARLISYIGYMTCSGSFASWYFSSSPDAERLKHATLKAFLRAISTSLGSLALASLLFAGALLLRLILKLLKKCDSCSKKMTEKVKEYVNPYAIVVMALYGTPFVQASQEAKKLVKSVESIDGPMEVLLVWFALGFGGGCSALTLALTATKYTENDNFGMPRDTYLLLVTFAVFIIAAWVAWTAVQPLHAALNAVFYCYFEDSEPLKTAHPLVYKHLNATMAYKVKQASKTTAAKKTAPAKATAAAKKTATAAKKASTASSAKKTATTKTTTAAKASTSSAPTAAAQPSAPSAAPSAQVPDSSAPSSAVQIPETSPVAPQSPENIVEPPVQ
jgi:hypothetical protein